MPASGRTASHGNQEIAEYAGTGTIALTRRFVYAARGLLPRGDSQEVARGRRRRRTRSLDVLLARLRHDTGNGHAYQFQDALGSVIALANPARGLPRGRDTGLVTETYAYTAFGLAALRRCFSASIAAACEGQLLPIQSSVPNSQYQNRLRR